MDNEKLHALISKLGPEFTGRPGYWQMNLYNLGVIVITDEPADRIRIMAPIKQVESLDANELFRRLQANFHTTLDARYAIARGVL